MLHHLRLGVIFGVTPMSTVFSCHKEGKFVEKLLISVFNYYEQMEWLTDSSGKKLLLDLTF